MGLLYTKYDFLQQKKVFSFSVNVNEIKSNNFAYNCWASIDINGIFIRKQKTDKKREKNIKHSAVCNRIEEKGNQGRDIDKNKTKKKNKNSRKNTKETEIDFFLLFSLLEIKTSHQYEKWLAFNNKNMISWFMIYACELEIQNSLI